MRAFTILLASVATAIITAGGGCRKQRPAGVPASAPASAAPAAPAPSLRYIGREAGGCAACHPREAAAWEGSHHDRAMELPSPQTVKGDFNNTTFTHFGVTTTFSRRGDEFRVTTDGPDGKPTDYRVAYTFGVYPLQQYLIEFPGGRYQALNVCWDDRPAAQGGQRWFHLYPGEPVPHTDILHWTGAYQNWNHMCAECHSTNVRKNASADGKAFNTTFSELDVSCEACHGPASLHVELARGASKDWAGSATKGFATLLREPRPPTWLIDPATGIAKRDTPLTTRAEADTCARCHARRGTFNEDFTPGESPLQTHRLALLEPALYEVDGQIKDEVYEYQSFLQSRMHAAGVTCTDCHDPHSLKVGGVDPNDACARCHEPAKFDTPAHTYHARGAAGSACIACHMPTKNYMVVHARHDHSLRVPRPDLTLSIGVPNACNGCHTDKSPRWAADEIARRTANKPLRPHFGVALAAGRSGSPAAAALLAALAVDSTQPAIARATAVEMLGGPAQAVSDPDPLVRAAAARALVAPDEAVLTPLIAPLLSDPVRQVRIDAARRLAALPAASLTPQQAAARERALGEFAAAQALDADRPESRLNLGTLAAERGQAIEAERLFHAAIDLNPRFPASYVNLADLYRQLGRDVEAVDVLRDGLASAPDNADIPHALGLALVRQRRIDDALPMLERASRLAPDAMRYAYVYAVALESSGAIDRALAVLNQAVLRQPADVDLLTALVTYNAQSGRTDEALTFAQRLAAVRPDDPGVRAMIQDLQSRRPATAPTPR